MTTGRTHFLIPAALCTAVAASAASARTFEALDRAPAADGVGASIAAVLREAATDGPRLDVIEPAVLPPPLPPDRDFGGERFPAFDDTIDSPPVPAEPKTKWIRIQTDAAVVGPAERACRPSPHS
jgi:hypothetical protein